MKKFLKETKWILIISFLLILSICLVFIFLLPCEDQRLLANIIIQASAIVTLVVVTLSYVYYTKTLADQAKEQSSHVAHQAMQTTKLAYTTNEALEEQKEKRTADHNERRLDEFYRPFIEKLNNMKKEIAKRERDDSRTWEIIINTRNLFLKKSHMVSIETLKKLKKIEPLFFTVQAAHPQRENMLKKFIDKEDEIRKNVINEWNEIEDEIRKFYGY